MTVTRFEVFRRSNWVTLSWQNQVCNTHSGVAPANQTKKGQFMNFSQGHSGTKVQCESCLFSQGKTPELIKMGEIHELFVLALSLVWFAGATPDTCTYVKNSEHHPM